MDMYYYILCKSKKTFFFLIYIACQNTIVLWLEIMILILYFFILCRPKYYSLMFTLGVLCYNNYNMYNIYIHIYSYTYKILRYAIT